jgi:hypothetical protein
MSTMAGQNAQTNGPQLSPPWFTVANQVKYTVGLTPGVTVGELNTAQQPYQLPITVEDPIQSQALAAILKPQYSLGNIEVQVQINPGAEAVKPAAVADPAQVVQLIQTALKGNPLLVDVLVKQAGPWAPTAVWPIFTRSVVQFFNDDISDYYSNYNGVAAQVFGTVLLGEIGGTIVNCSTTKQ